MGFVLLGLMTLNQIGLSGAVYQMFSHGIIAGLLFAVVGRMVYDRTHTRDLGELSRLPLARLLPFAAVTFVLAFMASVGLPGFSGFIAELQVLLGTWRAFPRLASPWFACLAGLGILIGIAFSWRALQATFFGDAKTTTGHALPPITFPRTPGSGSSVTQHDSVRSLSPATDESNRRQPHRIIVRASSPGCMAMTELLRLTAPEIVVALAGLLVLMIDLSLSRRVMLATAGSRRSRCILHWLRNRIWRYAHARGAAGRHAGRNSAQPAAATSTARARDPGASTGELSALYHARWRVLRPDALCHGGDDVAGEPRKTCWSSSSPSNS